jgi:probable HAF family extracellular repeat protein
VRAIEYSFTPLGDIGGYMVANHINDAGLVVGDKFFEDDSAIGAFLYGDGIYQQIFLPTYNLSHAAAINNNGQIVGHYYPSPERFTPDIFYYKNGQVSFLPNKASHNQAISVVTINDNGQILFNQQEDFDGASATTSVKSYIYRNGEFEDVGSLGGIFTNSNDINNAGQVVGGSTTSNGSQRAFIYTNSVIKEIPLEENPVPWSVLYSFGHAINDHGHVVGIASQFDETFNQTQSVFLYRNGMTEDLGWIGMYSEPEDINDLDQIVGSYFDFGESEGQSVSSAFTYQDELGLVDLNSLLDSEIITNGWVLNSANAINNRGQIVGLASNTNYINSVFSYILTPVPEPETYAMLLCGFALIRLNSHNKRKLN